MLIEIEKRDVKTLLKCLDSTKINLEKIEACDLRLRSRLESHQAEFLKLSKKIDNARVEINQLAKVEILLIEKLEA